MSPRAKWTWGIIGVVATALLAWFATSMLGLSAIGGSDDGITTDIAEAGEEPSAILCSSQATTDAVRDSVFARAREASEDPEALSRLAGDSLARLDEAALSSYDESDDLATCTARLVIELPRGTEPAFGYRRRLRSEIEYVVHGGSGTIDRLRRADMVIEQLALADLSVRERDFGDLTREGDDPIGDLIEDIEGEPENPPPPRREGPPADGDPVDLLPPAMDGDGQSR